MTELQALMPALGLGLAAGLATLIGEKVVHVLLDKRSSKRRMRMRRGRGAARPVRPII